MNRLSKLEETPASKTRASQKGLSFIYKIFVLFFCLLFSSITLLDPVKNLKTDLQTLLLVVGFLLIGVFYLKLIVKTEHYDDIKQKVVGTVIFAFVISICVFLFYWKLKSLDFITPFAAGAAFALPTITFYAWILYESIPSLQYDLWYKRDNLIDNKAFVFFNSVSIQLKVAPHISDRMYSLVELTVPNHIELGKLFHYFLIQQLAKDIDIETTDENGEPIGWQFFISKHKGFKVIPLDPDKNLLENGVSPNSVIVAKRVISEQENFVYSVNKEEHELY